MSEIAIEGLVLICLVAIYDWRRGVYLAVIVAFLQDPMRKLVDGQPPYFILFTGIVFGAAALGAMMAKVPLRTNMVIGWQRYAAVPFQFFVVVVTAQAIHSFLEYRNAMISGLGLISYLAPFLALAVAHAFAASGGSRRVRAFLVLYTVCASVSLTTVYLESLGFDLRILGQVGEGMVIFDPSFGAMNSYSGIFRAAEIAAWHAAICACVVLLLMTHRRISVPRIMIALAIVAVIVAFGALTGRRKFIVMIIIFCGAYGGLVLLFCSRARALAIPAMVLGALAYGIFLVAYDPDVEQKTYDFSDPEYQAYIRRTSSAFGDVNERFVQLGLGPVMWSYESFGLLGGGAGIGTQGAQQVAELGVQGAAEGGLGKIMLELGLPGLIACAAMGWGIARHVWTTLRRICNHSAEHTRLACGLTALLITNFASFSVASQAFGDIFILLFIGVCLGSLLAIPRILAHDLRFERPVAQGPARVVAGQTRTF